MTGTALEALGHRGALLATRGLQLRAGAIPVRIASTVLAQKEDTERLAHDVQVA